MSRHLYMDDDCREILVDDVLRYEQLDAGLERACRRIGIPYEGLHVRAKSGFREDGTRTVFDAVHRACLDHVYAIEFALFADYARG